MMTGKFPPGKPGGEGALVLVADDNDDIRDMLDVRLTARGFRVIAATDGQAALEAVHQHQPDVIVLDWVMPVIQGHELCVKLKTNPATARIPIIMLTARAEEGDRLLGLDLGADAFMIKPFDIDELEATIRRLHAAAGSGAADRPGEAGDFRS